MLPIFTLFAEMQLAMPSLADAVTGSLTLLAMLSFVPSIANPFAFYTSLTGTHHIFAGRLTFLLMIICSSFCFLNGVFSMTLGIASGMALGMEVMHF